MVNTAIRKTIEIWPTVRRLMAVPHTQEDYERILSVLDAVTDEVGENERHPLASLMETLGVLVESYEAAHVPDLRSGAADVVSAIVQEHGLTQSELPEIGSQGVVSDVLRGKRKLNLRQINALSKRFHLSPLVFLEEGSPRHRATRSKKKY